MNVVQAIINSIITAAELGILAVGLTMTFSLLRFANFAHVEAAVLGAYLAYFFNVDLGWNFSFALIAAAVLMGCVGVVIDKSIFRRMRGISDLTPMVASLGLAIAIRHGIQAIWGPQHVRYDFGIYQGEKLFGAYITRPQIAIILIVAVAVIGFHILLKYTKVGKAMRATATNPELAEACSINTEKVIMFVWFIGTAFAAIGGVLVAWDTQLDPYLGFNLVIPVFCVVLIGGVGSIYGAIAGALVIGFVQNFGVVFDFSVLLNIFGLADHFDNLMLPVAYKPAIVYGAVILILILRPGGLAKRELL